MGMRVAEYRLHSTAGDRMALVVTPDTRVRVGRARLESLRRKRKSAQPSEGGEIDREILDHVRRHGAEDRIVVFRGRSPAGDGSWRFAEDLSETERFELGFQLVADELATYRRLVAAGVFALVHVEWGTKEMEAYRKGTERLLDELEASSVPEVGGDPSAVAIDRADRWILRNLTHYYDGSFDEVVRSVLVAHLARFEERIPHFRAMVAGLPEEVTN
ncbi:MAG: hypothetical protein AAGE52_10955 [Myxococcota bacterium]